MKLTDIPAKQAVPFGVNGQREALLPTTPAGDNKASYNNGFPPVTMIMKSAGGVPPKGQDMNQILFELSSLCRWFSAGGAIPFDQSFCTSISGYPKGSRILGNDGSTVYISTIESNTNDPNTSSTGWLNLAKLSSIAGLMGGVDKLPYFTGNDTADQTNLTQVGRDIIAKATVAEVLEYLRLGADAPPIGIPFFWPSAVMPNAVMDEWSDMVFLKINGSSFSASAYPKLARVWPGLVLTDLRGEFPRIWDDGRGVDPGRGLLSSQGDAIRNITGGLGQLRVNQDINAVIDIQSATGAFSGTPEVRNNISTNFNYVDFRPIIQDVSFSAANVVPTASENRPRNIAFNFLVRAK